MWKEYYQNKVIAFKTKVDRIKSDIEHLDYQIQKETDPQELEKLAALRIELVAKKQQNIDEVVNYTGAVEQSA